MKKHKCTGKIILYAGLLVLVQAVCSGVRADTVMSSNGETRVLRLTQSQYSRTIKELFGEAIDVGGRFEPDVRVEGLLAVGAGQVSITPAGFEQYYGTARSIAAQVVDKANRDTLIPCRPVLLNHTDDACARAFLKQAGRYLYRRPLTSRELESEVATARGGARSLKDFYAGLSLGLTNLLVSPSFLFRKDVLENDPDQPGKVRLDAYSKASRLSFFLLDRSPDDALLRAAETGEIHSDKGLQRQVGRLLDSPRVEDGLRAFFTDMLHFDQFQSLSKDAALYPKFSGPMIELAQEQTLRTIVDHLLTQQGDYRDLFTSRKTFLTPTLGILYAVPVVTGASLGAPEKWVPVTLPADNLSAGILTHASFVSLHSHPGRTSPTLRGRALREVFLCQKVPDPPANVNFTVVQDTNNPIHKTARERLNAHATDAMCSGCHKITDPIGLALETSDTAAGLRLDENGVALDTNGQLDGIKYSDAAGLGRAVHDNAALASCIVNRVFSFGTGRPVEKIHTDFLKATGHKFAKSGYRFPALLAMLAESQDFYFASP